MVDKSVIIRRTQEIEKHLRRLSAYTRPTFEQFMADPVAQDMTEYNLFQIVNHLIDMVQHIVVDEGYGAPESAYEASDILAEKGVFTAEDVQLFRRMVGFRNIIGHDYVGIDKKVVYSILSTGPKDISSLVARITSRFL